MCSIPISTMPARGNATTIPSSAEARSTAGAPKRASETWATRRVPMAKTTFSTSGVQSCTPNARSATARPNVHRSEEEDDEKWKGVQPQTAVARQGLGDGHVDVGVIQRVDEMAVRPPQRRTQRRREGRQEYRKRQQQRPERARAGEEERCRESHSRGARHRLHHVLPPLAQQRSGRFWRSAASPGKYPNGGRARSRASRHHRGGH